MRFLGSVTSLLTLVLAIGVVVAVPAIAEGAVGGTRIPQTVDDFQALAIKSLRDAEVKANHRGKPRGCTLANARVRRDW